MSNEQKERKMTQSEKITKLIEITELLTKRCMKIEKNAIEGISALNKRIAELEEGTSEEANDDFAEFENI